MNSNTFNDLVGSTVRDLVFKYGDEFLESIDELDAVVYQSLDSVEWLAGKYGLDPDSVDLDELEEIINSEEGYSWSGGKFSFDDGLVGEDSYGRVYSLKEEDYEENLLFRFSQVLDRAPVELLKKFLDFCIRKY